MAWQGLAAILGGVLQGDLARRQREEEQQRLKDEKAFRERQLALQEQQAIDDVIYRNAKMDYDRYIAEQTLTAQYSNGVRLFGVTPSGGAGVPTPGMGMLTPPPIPGDNAALPQMGVLPEDRMMIPSAPPLPLGVAAGGFLGVPPGAMTIPSSMALPATGPVAPPVSGAYVPPVQPGPAMVAAPPPVGAALPPVPGSPSGPYVAGPYVQGNLPQVGINIGAVTSDNVPALKFYAEESQPKRLTVYPNGYTAYHTDAERDALINAGTLPQFKAPIIENHYNNKEGKFWQEKGFAFFTTPEAAEKQRIDTEARTENLVANPLFPYAKAMELIGEKPMQWLTPGDVAARKKRVDEWTSASPERRVALRKLQQEDERIAIAKKAAAETARNARTANDLELQRIRAAAARAKEALGAGKDAKPLAVAKLISDNAANIAALSAKGYTQNGAWVAFDEDTMKLRTDLAHDLVRQNAALATLLAPGTMRDAYSPQPVRAPAPVLLPTTLRPPALTSEQQRVMSANFPGVKFETDASRQTLQHIWVQGKAQGLAGKPLHDFVVAEVKRRKARANTARPR